MEMTAGQYIVMRCSSQDVVLDKGRGRRAREVERLKEEDEAGGEDVSAEMVNVELI